MSANSTSLTLTRCTIDGNSSQDGTHGGVYISAGIITLAECTISNNSAHYHYAGGSINSSSGTITNCIISGNSADYDVGGLALSGTLTVTNCTIQWEYCRDYWRPSS